MASCVECHRQIQDSFAFCPICGADNRPPERQEPITFCDHQFVPGGQFCILCGAGFDEPVGSTPATRRRSAIGFVLIGCAFAMALSYFIAGAYSVRIPGSDVIQSLFGSRYGTGSYSYYRHGYTSSRSWGDEICWGLGGMAMLCFVQAFRLQKRLQTLDSTSLAEMAWWEFLWF